VYCPQCKLEYREGFTECSDCHVPLVTGTPPDPHSEFDPDLDVVDLLETQDSIQLAMVKGLLEDSGIPFYLDGQITTLVNDVSPFLQKRVRVQVPREREAEVRELLAVVLQPDPDQPLEDDAAGVSGGNA
jgi:hypothetical protein